MSAPSFLTDYEGLQIRYLLVDELIIVPSNVTSTKGIMNFYEKCDFPAYWFVNEKEYSLKYHVKWKRIKNKVLVHYVKDDNSNICEFCKKKFDFDIQWGTEEYVFGNDNQVMEVIWKPYDEKKEYSSERNPRTIGFNYGLINDRRGRRTVEQLKRDQAIFRQRLLDIDNCCAVSEVDIKEAIQAAHIIAVKNGGREEIKNGILLRSDLHSLFDAGIMKISNEGIVSFNFDKSSCFKGYEAFVGRRIPEMVLNRVREQLKRRT